MNNEPNKPIPAQELTEKELEGIVGGAKVLAVPVEKMEEVKGAECPSAVTSIVEGQIYPDFLA